LWLALVGGAVFAVPGAAWGTTGHAFVGQFGGNGGGPGLFQERFGNGPAAVAVNASTGDVLTIDGSYVGVARVQRFDAAGVVQDSFPIEPPFAPAQANDIAVDPGSGAVYVSTLRNEGEPVVLKYNAAGDPPQVLDVAGSGTSINFGAQVAVDPVDGTVYVTATVTDPDSPSVGAQVIDSFDPVTGSFVASFDGASGSPDGGFQCPSDLAVDGSQQIYVLDACKGRVDRYSGAGVFGATVDDGSRNGQPVSPLLAVAADPSSSDVYVAETGVLGMQITHFAAGGTSLVYTFDASNVGGVRAMAVSGAGTVYTSDNTTPFVERFARFDGPTVTTDPPTAVDTRTVTLNGTFDPEGVDSSYHFEYGTGFTYGSRTPEVDVDGGSGPVAVSAAIDGLKPNQDYHYRLVGSRPGSPGSIAGGDVPFTTLLAPATVDGFPAGSSPAFASAITPRSASLHGLVNANNTGGAPPFSFQQATKYVFEYGTTTAYGKTAVGTDGGTLCAFGTCNGVDRAVATQVPAPGQPALEPGTEYHFRVVADNGTGGPQPGADQTFITAPAAGGGATGVTTRRATLTGTINPHGVGTTYHFNYGRTSAYGASTAEFDGGAGNGDQPVSHQVSGLAPDTIYHVQVVATSDDGVTRYGGDGLFRTAPAPSAVAISPIGVSTGSATLIGDVETHGLAGTYRFDVSSLDSSYQSSTAEQPVAGNDGVERVSVPVGGLPAGETFVVRLVVTSNDFTEHSDQVTFATAPLPPRVFPPPPSGDGASSYGCAAPRLDSYDAKPKPGDTIAISGRDLGAGGTATLGDRSSVPADWSATGFKLEIPEDAAGTLGLTVNCGQRSNTVAIAIFKRPSNRFSIANKAANGSAVTLSVKVPGPGKLTTSAANTKAAKTVVKRAGRATVKIRLTSSGALALRRSKGNTLKVMARVRFTPAGGRPATKTVAVTFKRKAGR
jgi:hypothetical protein